MRRALLILFLAVQSNFIFGQNIIKGKIIDWKDATAKSGISITLKNPTDSSTFAFGFSNLKGEFSIQFSTELDSILIQVAAMSIQKSTLKIPTSQDWIEVKVQAAEMELEEVMIEGIKNPISFKKDTISYAVDGFATSNDRVIADVLKRLPGIEVLSNGMIEYQGRPLGKFYIDGLDLLQGRYNLANNNLPADAVESIEILENHQPIRVLDSLTFSDQAALNLVLKKKTNWIGTGYGGLGGTPLAWNANLSPMVFLQNFQSLLSVQSNNFGNDLSNQQKPMTISELQNMLDENKVKNWFSVPTLKNGIVPRMRTLFNKDFLASANTLTKTATGTEFGIAIDFYRQIQDQDTDGATVFFLPSGDSIRFTENTRATIIQQNLKTSLNWTKNEHKKFFNNSFFFEVQSDTQTANTLFNDIIQDQEAKLPLIHVGNNLSLITPIGQVLAEINSNTSFQRTNQRFNVSPSGFESIFLDTLKEQLNQNLLFTRFFTHNSLGFKKIILSKIVLNNTLGLDFNVDRLESDLIKVGNSNSERQDLINATDYFSLNTYAKSGLEYSSNQFRAKFDLPLQYTYIQSLDPINQFETNLSKVYAEPYLYLRYQFSGKVYTSGSLRKTNSFGTGEDLFPGLILSTFRSLNLRNTEVPERIVNSLGYGLFFKDPVSSIFLNMNFG